MKRLLVVLIAFSLNLMLSSVAAAAVSTTSRSSYGATGGAKPEIVIVDGTQVG